MFKPRSSLSDEQIYQEIHDAIVEGRLAPGTKLSQDELAKVFGTSKTRLRPVLFRLAEQGIVSMEQNRGAFVAMPSIEEVNQVLDARILLEEGLMRRLSGALDEEQLQALRDVVQEEQEARTRNERAKAHRCSGRFHILLSQFTDNPVLVELNRMLISRNAVAVAMYQRGSCSIDGHSKIIEALSKGDTECAIQVAVDHLLDIKNSLDASLPQRAYGGLYEALYGTT